MRTAKSCLLGAVVIMLAGNSQVGSQPQADTPKPPSWMRVAEKAAFSPRDTAEDMVFNGKMWISNGYVAGGKLVRDLWSSSDGVTWTLVSDNTPYDGYSEMVVYDGKIWAVKASVWNSSDGVTWHEHKSAPVFSPRHEVTPYVFNGSLWVVGGNMWPLMNDVWRLTLPEAWSFRVPRAGRN